VLVHTVPFPRCEADVIASLRDVLRRADFAGDAIREVLQAQGPSLGRPADLPVHLHRLDGRDDAFALLVRLFVLGQAQPAGEVDRLLAPVGADELEAIGIVRREGDRIARTVKLIPHDELVIASDLPSAEGVDLVAGVHRPSLTLSHLTVRGRVRRALDMGTGNGVQALLLARHADEVVATDVNERALAFARFNALVNGVHNVEFRAGSFFEPVAGERFEVIATNPPYVVSPESEYLFRDSGMGRDRVSEEVVRALPAHLDQGGYATVMVSWIADPDAPDRRALDWLEGAGCDAWLFHTSVDSALETASAWNRDAATAEEYGERVDRWLEYYREEAIDALGYGVVVLRRRDGANWVRSVALPAARLAPAGGQLERMFAAQDVLARSDGELLDSRYRFVDRVRVTQEAVPSGDRWAVSEVVLRLDEGLGFTAGLDEVTSRIVLVLDPSRSFRDTLAAVGQERGIDGDTIESGGVHLLRRMLELGFVVPV
jgi:methylase of polypeptide subunit release factors